MNTLDSRPSLRLLRQVSQIERFCGAWQRLAPSMLGLGLSEQAAILQGVCAIVQLDQSSDPVANQAARELDNKQFEKLEVAQHLARDIVKKGSVTKGNVVKRQVVNGNLAIEDSYPEQLLSLMKSHCSETNEPLSAELIDQLYCQLSSEVFEPKYCADSTQYKSQYYRSSTGRFQTPNNEVVFTTISAFLIEQRLRELINWTNQEIGGQTYHPIIVAGVFYLLFLQISPYPLANHSVAQVLLWKLLSESGYDFVCYNHLACQFKNHQAQYFSSLRQAEKTAGGTWSSLNIWLEFFAECLLSSIDELRELLEKQSSKSRLSAVQQDILNVVKTRGTATRDTIVKDTGINKSTVKYNLSVLSSRGHLRRQGGGRTTSYSIT